MWIISGLSKTLLKSSKSYVCETFRVLKYLLSIFLLYTHPCHMILSKQKCCLLLSGVSRESQKLTSVRQIRRGFSQTRIMSRIYVGLELNYVKLLLSSLKIYMCNLMAWYTNKKWGFLWALTAPLIADLFLYCYKRDFMSNLQKSKRFDLIDKFNDTSRYLDYILTIYSS